MPQHPVHPAIVPSCEIVLQYLIFHSGSKTAAGAAFIYRGGLPHSRGVGVQTAVDGREWHGQGLQLQAGKIKYQRYRLHAWDFISTGAEDRHPEADKSVDHSDFQPGLPDY